MRLMHRFICKYLKFALFVLLHLYFLYVYSFWILPSLVLKKMVMGNFATEKVDGEIIEAIDFMVERV